MYEIERKYLISYPDVNALAAIDGSYKIEIMQDYLTPGTAGENRRVRKWVTESGCKYIYTQKQKISNLKRIENEYEITKDKYDELLKEKDSETHTIEKVRYRVPYGGLVYEIDIFPFWDDQAYMEAEIESESQEISIPPFVKLIREVTDDKRFSNNALAHTSLEELKGLK